MRVLSLTQPWATFVALGLKRFETRSWSTPYRGPLAIHAALGFPPWARALCDDEPYAGLLRAAGFPAEHLAEALPRGAILVVGELIQCQRTDVVAPTLTPTELALGNFEPGRYAWTLRMARRLTPPVEHRGAQGIRRLDAAVIAAVLAAPHEVMRAA